MPALRHPHKVRAVWHADIGSGIRGRAQGLRNMPPRGGEADQHEAAKSAHETPSNKFTAYGIELKHVNEFKYLGRQTSFVNSDVPALCHNLKKGRGL